MIHREISEKNFQIDALDGLRGFAALIVVLSHTSNSGLYVLPFLDLRGIGKAGVFLFFLLSAFLLTLSLLRKGRAILTISVMSHYWQRRFFRIYPLYILYLIIGVISTWFSSKFLGKNGVGIPFCLDWHDFFEHIVLQSSKGVTWSIAVEFKFYFILPVLTWIIVFARSYGLMLPTIFFLALILLSLYIKPQSNALTNDMRLIPYMPIFIGGMFVAFLQDYINNNKYKSEKFVNLCKYLGYLGVVGIIVMTPLVVRTFGKRVPFDFFHKQFVLYAVFWSFILLSAVNVKGVVQRFFNHRLLRFYGALSFSLYLFHPIFIDTLKLLEINKYICAWLVILISTCSSYFSFKIIEYPMSKFKISIDFMLTMFACKKNN